MGLVGLEYHHFTQPKFVLCDGLRRKPSHPKSKFAAVPDGTVDAGRHPGADTIGAPQWLGYTAICSQQKKDTIADDTYANYWFGMLALGASRHDNLILSAFMDGHAGKRPANQIVLQNCTYQSADYYNWYAKPAVNHFAGTYFDATE